MYQNNVEITMLYYELRCTMMHYGLISEIKVIRLQYRYNNLFYIVLKQSTKHIRYTLLEIIDKHTL